MTVTIRAFPDSPIKFAGGAYQLAFSLEDGAYDMSRMVTPGLPLLAGHDDARRIGTITGYQVARPDPDGEGAAAMMLTAELLPDTQMAEAERAVKEQVLGGTMRGTSGHWAFDPFADGVLEKMEVAEEPAFGAWRVRNWAFIEDSVTNIPLVQSARILSVAASGDVPGNATLATILAAKKEEMANMAEQTAMAAGASIDYEKLAEAMAKVQASAATATEPAVDLPPQATASPASPEQTAATSQAASGGVTANVGLVSAVAAMQTEQAAMKERLERLASINVIPDSIEKAAAVPGQFFNISAAMAMSGMLGEVKSAERDYPFTTKRVKDTADMRQGGNIVFPQPAGGYDRGMPLTRDDIRSAAWGSIFQKGGAQAQTLMNDVVQTITRTGLTPDPNIETFPYKERLDVIRAVGEMQLPVVKELPVVQNPAENVDAAQSKYATEKETLTPHRASIFVRISDEALFFSPTVEGELSAVANRLIRADDQKFVETTWSSSQTQGIYAIAKSGAAADKVVVGAAGANFDRDKVLEAEEDVADAVKGAGYDTFYALSNALYRVGRGVEISSNTGLYLIEGNMHMGRIGGGIREGQTMDVYRSSFLGGYTGVLISGGLYKFAEWQGVMLTRDPFSESEFGRVRFVYTSWRDGVALYTNAFPYFATA